MADITFVSNKTRKELVKYIFIITYAVSSWILQVSIFSRLLCFDTAPNLLLLGSIYAGLSYGPLMGALFGIVSSFLSSCILYDHIFYFSLPLIGLLAGLLTKNLFSDELLFFLLLSFLFTLPCESLNGWQYSLKNPTNIIERLLLVGLSSAILNVIFGLFCFWIMSYITKKLNLR